MKLAWQRLLGDLGRMRLVGCHYIYGVGSSLWDRVRARTAEAIGVGLVRILSLSQDEGYGSQTKLYTLNSELGAKRPPACFQSQCLASKAHSVDDNFLRVPLLLCPFQVFLFRLGIGLLCQLL